jgi:tetratricopeptide (TPR) repeat protein
MKENLIKNKQCPICGEYILKDSKFCKYCGEKLQEGNDTEEIIQENQNTLEKNNAQKEKVIEQFDKNEFMPHSNLSKKQKVVLGVVVSIIIGIAIALGGYFYMHKNFNDEIPFNISEPIPKPHILNKGNTENIDSAKILYKEGNIDEAAQLFQNEIYNANDPVAYYYLGEIYKDGGYTKIAIENYKKALEYKNNFYEPQKRLAQMYLAKSENDTALTYANSALKQNPDDVELLKTLASIYYNLNDSENLRQTHQKIANLDKKDYYSNYYMAYYYYDKNEYREAIPYLCNLVDNNYNTDIAYSLVISYTNIEYYTKAIETLDIIIKNDPYEYYSATYAKSRLSDMKAYYNATHKKSSTKSPKQNYSTTSTSNNIDYNKEAENDLF